MAGVTPRIPLWLKIGWTAWLAVWAPVYWYHYGPSNFLWFCDVGNFMIGLALWRESRLLFSWQAVAVLIVQLFYAVDLFGRLLLGFHPIGGTGYMFKAELPLYLRLLSLFHLATPPVLLWALRRLGYDRRAPLFQTATAWILLPICYLGFGPAFNYNWVWGPFDKPQDVIAPGLYLIVCMAVYPLVLYLPTHFALSWLNRRWRDDPTTLSKR